MKKRMMMKKNKRNDILLNGHIGPVSIAMTVTLPKVLLPQQSFIELTKYDPLAIAEALQASKGVVSCWFVTNCQSDDVGVVVPRTERGRDISHQEAALRANLVFAYGDMPRTDEVALVKVMSSEPSGIGQRLWQFRTPTEGPRAYAVEDHCESCGSPLFEGDERVTYEDDVVTGVLCCGRPPEATTEE